MLIGDVKNHLWEVAGRVARALPEERVPYLEQAVFRLTALPERPRPQPP